MVLFHDTQPYLYVMHGAFVIHRYAIDYGGRHWGETLDLSDDVADSEAQPEVFYMSVWGHQLAVAYQSGFVRVLDVDQVSCGDGCTLLGYYLAGSTYL
jgi:hypothetical protein